MKKIEFNASEEGKHECASKKEGDLIVYTCPLCPDYERKYNTKTGEMYVKCREDNRNLHTGDFAKPGFGEPYNPN